MFDALERLDIRYFITGSVAASVYGVLRQSHDTDIVLDLKVGEFGPLASAWQQSDAMGPMSDLERAEFLLRRLYPALPDVSRRQILEQLAAAEAAGEWHGFRSPDPLVVR